VSLASVEAFPAGMSCICGMPAGPEHRHEALRQHAGDQMRHTKERLIWYGIGFFTFLTFLLPAQGDQMRYEVLRNEHQGALLPSYEWKFFGSESANTYWVVDGPCNSACTMVLGTGRVCATPRPSSGFMQGILRSYC